MQSLDHPLGRTSIQQCESKPIKIRETCASNSQCDTGLWCETCLANGNTQPKMQQPDTTYSFHFQRKGLPLNRYSWLTTHNSYALSGATSATGSGSDQPGGLRHLSTQCMERVNGVRGLMLDIYDYENDIWLCNSLRGICFDLFAFQPAISVLKEIKSFLEANPTKIVTIFIEDYVTSLQGLTKNKRLLVFTSKSSKEASEGIVYQWRYVVENQYGDAGMVSGTCPNRAESPALDTMTISLFMENYFPDNPYVVEACVNNSDPLTTMMQTCHQKAGKRWPNFIAVDFYQISDGGGAPEAADEVNGHLTRGCNNIAYCKDNATFETCDGPQLAPPPPAALPHSTDRGLSFAPLDARPLKLYWLLGIIPALSL
ncbi:hypothetical protein MLD38_004592 [Melastoma candidum]|uniref:Uncharacterized protein n=1 Tax=Melastoma candidum TaxID=119954 RepID=A0ACB9S668_9MYRT|nr:hypothetical protein MLD38_004592 [Melastoma candidum]